MKREAILIAVCIAFFVAVALQGVQFINAPENITTYTHKNHLEGFNAVTRATDCNCLPGYIPGKENDAYICQSLDDPKKKRKCY